jgi:hypothetical protein
MSQEYSPKFKAAQDILCTLLQRPDRGLFNYDEMADMAFEYADALERRFEQEMKASLANKQATQAAMTAQYAPTLSRSQLDALRYGLGVVEGLVPKPALDAIRPREFKLLDPDTAALWGKEI